ncbi:MAG TPA: DUF4412 domain-containing protein [Polyangiaceae bacterium]|jgi:hypothetical protein
MQARFSLVALALLAPAGCKKGFGSDFEGSITMHVRSQAGESDLVVKTKNEKMRFENRGSWMLYDPKASTVTMVDDASKTFTPIDFKSASAPKANTSPDTAKIEKSGQHETIAGVDCEKWTVHDGGKRSEVCIAQGIAFFDIGSLKSGQSSALAKELREQKLFPLRDAEYDADGKELSRMEVTKVEKKSIPDADLEVPKDYKQLAVPGN